MPPNTLMFRIWWSETPALCCTTQWWSAPLCRSRKTEAIEGASVICCAHSQTPCKRGLVPWGPCKQDHKRERDQGLCACLVSRQNSKSLMPASGQTSRSRRVWGGGGGGFKRPLPRFFRSHPTGGSASRHRRGRDSATKPRGPNAGWTCAEPLVLFLLPDSRQGM